MCKNELFQSSRMKNELHVKFRDENNTFAEYIVHFACYLFYHHTENTMFVTGPGYVNIFSRSVFSILINYQLSQKLKLLRKVNLII
jgi:hypothetical protein